ncbi:gliding motility-associated protein GldE [Paucihalobacter ruber]|uniref:Gliding motility-associated protein GldE n=2 Tax=Paucihalobacter ruber TaxID=2567861 RepID=A0A506PMM1_9FLAO|nr:gliding motility-associated protein GldE [Paucihalobacter ruber]
MVDTPFIVGTVLMVILLFFSGLISGSEVALFSLTKANIEQGLEKYPGAFKIIEKLLDRPKKLLATILVANNFINIAIVLLFAGLGETLFVNIESYVVKFILEVVLATFLILLFGEIIPKIYASRKKELFARKMAVPLNFLDTLITPISMPMRYVTIILQNKLGRQKSNIGVEKLSQALELTSENNTKLEDQRILEGIVTFGNTETRQVMRPRVDIFAIEIESSFEEVIKDIVEHGYSRIPVYEDTLDNIKGILYTKDLLPHINKTTFNWQDIIRPAFFVPENKKLDDLMIEFKSKKVHLAVVVDEYGGTSGLLSLEDIIEEIVGDISDEYDDDDLVFTKIDDYNYIFEGKTNLKDFYKIISLEDDTIFETYKGEAETIAGFILEISKAFPRIGSNIKFKNYIFTVEALDKKRIKQVKLQITPPV